LRLRVFALQFLLDSPDEESPMSVEDDLVVAARETRLFAYAPYSGFKVGAALLCDDGKIVAGCNVENATYGLTICAERAAVFKAISEGYRPGQFKAVAVVADTEAPTPPCGACRQILWEFCGDVDVILANLSAVKDRRRLAELLPSPFDDRLLKSS
jgi:cytidine deaminase